MKPNINIRVPQKLSIITIVIVMIDIFKRFWPLILIVIYNFFNNNRGANNILDKSTYYLWGLFIFIFLVKFNDILKYFTTRFYVNEQNEFVITSGLITKLKTIIALDKIQSIQSSQSIINRLNNTVKVKIETAGSSHAEGVLLAITLQQQQALQLLVDEQIKGKIYPSITENRENKYAPLISKNIGLQIVDILKLSISENHIKTLLLILAFGWSRLHDLKQYMGIDTDEWIIENVNSFSGSFKIIAIVTAILMAVSILVSTIKIFIKYFDFKLSILPSKFLASWGLLSTQQKTIPYNKIQQMEWSANAFRRVFKMWILQIFATGDNSKRDSKLQIPITQTSHLKEIVNNYQPNLASNENVFLKIEKPYILRSILLIGLPV